MQTRPTVRGHWRTESCSIGADRRVQREAAVTSALVLQCTFTVHGDVLERVEVFKYLVPRGFATALVVGIVVTGGRRGRGGAARRLRDPDGVPGAGSELRRGG